MTDVPEGQRNPEGAAALAEATQDIWLELGDRLALSEMDRADQLAIMTAIKKAMVAGYNRAARDNAAELTDKFNRAIDDYCREKNIVLNPQLAPKLQIDLYRDMLTVPDHWAEECEPGARP